MLTDTKDRPLSASSHPVLVSVVTPVYNGAAFIRECIESVLGQTYSNWEYTILNNCSSDASLQIALEYAARDPRIRVVNSPQLVPAIANHNAALRLISPASKYTKVVFADDWLFPECLKEMVALAEQHPSVGIVGSFRLHGNVVDSDGPPHGKPVMSGREICRLALLSRTYPFGSSNSVLFRSDLVRSRDPFFDESNVHSDSETCYDLMQKWDFGFVHQVLTFTRDQGGTLTAESYSQGTLFAGVLKELLKYGPNCLTPEECQLAVQRLLRDYYRFLGRRVFSKQDRAFWQLHAQRLDELGLPLSRTRVAVQAARHALDRGLALNYWPFQLLKRTARALPFGREKRERTKVNSELPTALPPVTDTTELLLPEVGVLAMVPDKWDSPWQARHHVLTQLARFFHVVWIEPPREWREIFQNSENTPNQNPPSLKPAGLHIYKPEFWLPQLYRPAFLEQSFLRTRLRHARRLLAQRGCRKIILYLWRPEFAKALQSVPFDSSCYHIDDEYSFSDVELPLDEEETSLVRTVDRVFIHSRGLFEKKGWINAHTICVPNGVDYPSFSRSMPEPSDLADIPHPRVGYTGFLKKTLDWDLCRDLVQRHPEWSFVFVGPAMTDPKVAEAIRELSAHSNVHFLGTRSPLELASYPQHFDVCIMPYRTATHSMKYGYPLKLHEYLASGRPTIGTPLASLLEFADVVTLASTPEQWSAAILAALGPDANTPELRSRRQAVAQGHDWRYLVLRIAKAMAESLGNSTADRLADLTGGADA